MVNGLPKFKQHFSGFEDSYIIIGGTACERHLEGASLTFRRTDDLDIVIVAEALTQEFVERFWDFVEQGKYNTQEKEQKDNKFFRFANPQTPDYPYQLELFTRQPDVLKNREGSRLTPIPIDADLDSLSAILMDNDYYNFTIENSEVHDGIHIASPAALLALKAKAYLDLSERKNQGGNIDKGKVNKHRSDIIRMMALVPGDLRVEAPQSIRAHLQTYIAAIQQEKPDVKAVLKNAGLSNLTHDQILSDLAAIFSL